MTLNATVQTRVIAFTLIELLVVIAIIDFDPHQIPVVFDKEAFHRARGEKKGVNHLYADGHIKNLLAIEGTQGP